MSNLGGTPLDHKIPYKDALQPLQEKLEESAKKPESGAAAGLGRTYAAKSSTGGKYIPPVMREGANKGRGDSMSLQGKDEAATIRVKNLPKYKKDIDLQELFRPFGPISRIYLVKDKATGQSKGLAFIKFQRQEDAARAIQGVSGFGYDNHILNVEWAKK